MLRVQIRRALTAHTDEQYKSFQSGLIPTLPTEAMLGVRTPIVRKLAKEFAGHEEVESFLRDLPHRYHEENVLHTFIIGLLPDFDRCMDEVERFLPYVDNWAVCDGLSPKVFPQHKPELLAACRRWLGSEHPYTVRFALVMLLKHFLTVEYAEEALALAAAVRSEAYYVNVAVSWLFAEGMGKCPEQTLPYFTGQQLPTAVHNKAIQKSLESYRVSEEAKAYLKTLKRKKS